MARIALIDFRTIIGQVTHRLGGAPPEDILAAVRKDHPKDVIANNDDLVDVGIIKLINEAGNRRRVQVPGQLSLFPGHSPPDILAFPPIKGVRKALHIPFDLATAPLVEEWIERRRARTKPRSRDAERVSVLLKELRPYIESDSTTMRQAAEKRRADEGGDDPPK